MRTEEIEMFRTSLREMVRELGMLNRNSSGTDLSPLQSHILIELNKNPAGVTELAQRLCTEKSSISRTCVFRFVRPPVPVSSGQAFRCDPASMI